MKKPFAGVCCVLTSLVIASAALNQYCTGGYEVIVEGKSIGYVETADAYKDALSQINDQLENDFGAEYTLHPELKLKGTIVPKDQITSQEDLEKSLASLTQYMEEGCMITVNGEELAALKTEETAKLVLDEILDQYTVSGIRAHFTENVELVTKQISTASFFNIDNAREFLLSSGKLHTEVKENQILHETIDFETVEEPDNSMYIGSRTTVQEGAVGEHALSVMVTYQDGVEISRETVSDVVTAEPVAEIVRVGTKEIPNQGTGNFKVPVSGRLSSGFGARWGRNHNGIDLSASVGTPIYASDTGVVICAEYKGSYGNLVKIDHKNGYVTYYAHCSEILVSNGQAVTQGQLIARVGNTGNSTGPHCHFEIQYQGTPQNPYNFIG